MPANERNMAEDEPAVDSAAATFANLPELMEAMLVLLPFRELLKAQKVNRTWKAIIENSPKLQKALFMRPIEDIQLQLVGYENTKASCRCKLKDDRAPPVKIVNEWNSTAHWAVDSEDMKSYRIVINPFLYYGTFYGSYRFISSSVNRWGPRGRLAAAASCKKMLLTQPPLKELIVRSSNATHFHKIRAQEGSAGVTLGDLLPALSAMNSRGMLLALKGIVFEDIKGSGPMNVKLLDRLTGEQVFDKLLDIGA